MIKNTGRLYLLLSAVSLVCLCTQPTNLPVVNFPNTNMRLITGGTFTMGSNDSAHDFGAHPPHQVTVSPFYMDSTEVTQLEYESILRNVDPSHFTGDRSRPVEEVTWFDAALYCNGRSKKDSLDTVYTYDSVYGTAGNGCPGLRNLAYDYTRSGYRLPTEAEWEFACRAGTTTEYYWGDTIDTNYCWYDSNSDSTTHPVAQKRPNAFGLYDMSGNVWEWCQDFYGPYSSGSQTDPTGPSTGPNRVVRGGAWNSGADSLRSAYRNSYYPGTRFGDIGGFRTVRRSM